MNANANVQIAYVSNSKRMEVYNETPTKVKIIFPTPLAEKLGLNRKFFDNPIGKKRYIITHSTDLKTTIRQLFKSAKQVVKELGVGALRDLVKGQTKKKKKKKKTTQKKKKKKNTGRKGQSSFEI